MRAVILFAFIGLSSYAEGGSLMAPKPQPEQPPVCCEGELILSCTAIDLNLTTIGDGDLYLEPLDTTLSFEGMVGDSTNAYHYGNDKVDFVLTVHAERGSVYGHAALDDDRSYVIEFCGDAGHVLKELDVQKLGENVGVDFLEDEEQPEGTSRAKRSAYMRAKRDTTTIVTYSVKIYYTPQVAASTSDIEGFVDQVIQETNQGYINSGVALRVKLHCIEQATINDLYAGTTILSNFRAMKGTTSALRGSADTAALLVNSFAYCGVAYMNTIGSGNTVSVTAKSCALGYYSFGHEIGHNIGLTHNKEVASNSVFSDGLGHLIAQGSASTGARTILAYNANGHRTRVNYYSNPNVIYPSTGTATGTSTANNARVLTVQRFALASVGDESTSCTDPPATTTTVSSLSSGVDCTIAGTWRTVRHRYIGTMSQSDCQSKCVSDSKCYSWVWNNSEQWCYMLEARNSYNDALYTAGPDFSKQSCYQSKIASPSTGISYDTYMVRTTASDGDACQAACAANVSCSRWNLYRTTCYMYRTYYRNYSGWTSGLKY